VPSNVQTLTALQLENFHPWSLPEALQNNLGSVSLSHTEGNPFQTNLDFHGYTASPALSTPQGLAIYQNGVRMNEPSGDVVYWDFVPLYVIEKLQLIPGSNPVFGLNGRRGHDGDEGRLQPARLAGGHVGGLVRSPASHRPIRSREGRCCIPSGAHGRE
jgi:hypothetical protein